MVSDQKQVIKFCLAGNEGVGKSCLAARLDQGDSYRLPTNHDPTIGVEFTSKEMSTPNRFGQADERFKFQIWDLSGGRRFESVIKSYFRGTNVFMIVFDVTNRESFEEGVPHHIALFEQFLCVDDDSTIVYLVAAKCDASPAERVVTTAEAQQLAQSKTYFYKETSAKTGQGVSELFEEIAGYAAKYGFGQQQERGHVCKSELVVDLKKKKSRGSFFPSLGKIFGKKDKNKDDDCGYETL